MNYRNHQLWNLQEKERKNARTLIESLKMRNKINKSSMVNTRKVLEVWLTINYLLLFFFLVFFYLRGFCHSGWICMWLYKCGPIQMNNCEKTCNTIKYSLKWRETAHFKWLNILALTSLCLASYDSS